MHLFSQKYVEYAREEDCLSDVQNNIYMDVFSFSAEYRVWTNLEDEQKNLGPNFTLMIGMENKFEGI